MKRNLGILLAVLLILGVTACGSNDSGSNDDASTAHISKSITKESSSEDIEGTLSEDVNVEETSSDKASDTQSKSTTLAVYFSQTGNTKAVAEKIADIENADIYEIKASEEYTDEDLDWNDEDSRSTKEQNDSSARPEIGSETITLDGYTKIYIGYPIWWGEEPRIMDTFVESYDFDNITMIPFCTSSSSDIESSSQNLSELAGSGTWLDGMRFAGDATEDEIKEWIDSIE